MADIQCGTNLVARLDALEKVVFTEYATKIRDGAGRLSVALEEWFAGVQGPLAPNLLTPVKSLRINHYTAVRQLVPDFEVFGSITRRSKSLYSDFASGPDDESLARRWRIALLARFYIASYLAGVRYDRLLDSIFRITERTGHLGGGVSLLLFCGIALERSRHWAASIEVDPQRSPVGIVTDSPTLGIGSVFRSVTGGAGAWPVPEALAEIFCMIQLRLLCDVVAMKRLSNMKIPYLVKVDASCRSEEDFLNTMGIEKSLVSNAFRDQLNCYVLRGRGAQEGRAADADVPCGVFGKRQAVLLKSSGAWQGGDEWKRAHAGFLLTGKEAKSLLERVRRISEGRSAPVGVTLAT